MKIFNADPNKPFSYVALYPSNIFFSFKNVNVISDLIFKDPNIFNLDIYVKISESPNKLNLPRHINSNKKASNTGEKEVYKAAKQHPEYAFKNFKK